MTTTSGVVCRLCGLLIRGEDAVAKVGEGVFHASCAETEYRGSPGWKHTQIGTLNQLSRGAIGGGSTI